ncbi:MAG TPA: hypothetical protein VHT75_04155 [Acidimicrobiales bacterium]|jgi:hypothetical protein|nr:hypothetical protein [Acidimicrobiales bacterium]
MTGPEYVDTGMYRFSKTHFHPGGDLQRGGAVIDSWADADGEVFVKVVGIYRGAPFYETFPFADTAPGAGGDIIQLPALRDLLLVLGTDEIRHKDPLKHLHAKSVLTPIVLARSPA